MGEDVDEVPPSVIDIQRIYTRSSQTWSSHIREPYLQNRFPSGSFRLRNILGNVPSYLGHLTVAQERSQKPDFDIHTKVSSHGLSTLCVTGESSWNVGQGNCEHREKILSHQLLLGVQKSISCSFIGDHSFATWTEPNGLGDCNNLSVLVLAWSYILSARWIEIQQASGVPSTLSKGAMMYLCSQANCGDVAKESSLNTLDIYIGDVDVDDDAVRWWVSILAKAEGWRAEIERDEGTFRSPWSMFNTGEHQFRFIPSSNSQNLFNSKCSPPVSDVALGYLIDFCLLHNAGSQCSAALAAVFTFPSLTNAGLPIPNSYQSSCQTETAQVPSLSASEDAKPRKEIIEDFDLLPYYMTLSCSSRGIESFLCNTFFNPEIPSNLVSSWIYPIFKIIDPLISKKDFQTLSMMLGTQQPKAAAMWTGAFITGMARSILQHCCDGFLATELHSAAWTNTIQTFMSLDPQPVREDSDSISRVDECRIHYLAGDELNSRVPICP